MKTHFYRTRYGYDQRGRPNMTKTPTGTIYRTVYDGLDRVVSQWVSTNDAGATRDDKKREIRRHYYFDVNKALAGPTALEEAVVAVGEDRVLRENFGRDVKLDLSTAEKEYATFHFPCDQILNSDAWEEGLNAAHPERFAQYVRFRKEVLNAFRGYLVPVIELKKETSKEAVCLVFEKVNTGGVSLSVFELLTASSAADGLNMRKEWFGEKATKGRHARLAAHPLLKDTAATDFLQGVSLLHTYERQREDLLAGRTGKEVTGVSAKREHILAMPSSAYLKWAEPLTKGFLEAEQFLRHLGFHHPKFLPYRAQLIPLAATLAHVKDRWLEPQTQDKRAVVLVRRLRRAVRQRVGDPHRPGRAATDGVAERTLRARAGHRGRGRLPAVPSGHHADACLGGLPGAIRPAPEGGREGLLLEGQDGGHRPQSPRHRPPPHIPAQVVRWARHLGSCLQLHRQQDSHLLQGEPQDRRQRPVALPQAARERQGGPASARRHGRHPAHPPDRPALLRADDFRAFYEARKAALLCLIERAMGKAAVAGGIPAAEDDGEGDDED